MRYDERRAVAGPLRSPRARGEVNPNSREGLWRACMNACAASPNFRASSRGVAKNACAHLSQLCRRWRPGAVGRSQTVVTRWLRGGYAVVTRWLRGGYTVVTRCLHRSGGYTKTSQKRWLHKDVSPSEALSIEHEASRDIGEDQSTNPPPSRVHARACAMRLHHARARAGGGI